MLLLLRICHLLPLPLHTCSLTCPHPSLASPYTLTPSLPCLQIDEKYTSRAARLYKTQLQKLVHGSSSSAGDDEDAEDGAHGSSGGAGAGSRFTGGFPVAGSASLTRNISTGSSGSPAPLSSEYMTPAQTKALASAIAAEQAQSTVAAPVAIYSHPTHQQPFTSMHGHSPSSAAAASLGSGRKAYGSDGRDTAGIALDVSAILGAGSAAATTTASSGAAAPAASSSDWDSFGSSSAVPAASAGSSILRKGPILGSSSLSGGSKLGGKKLGGTKLGGMPLGASMGAGTVGAGATLSVPSSVGAASFEDLEKLAAAEAAAAATAAAAAKAEAEMMRGVSGMKLGSTAPSVTAAVAAATAAATAPSSSSSSSSDSSSAVFSKYSSAKGISSSMVFGESEDSETNQKLQALGSAKAISSDMLYGGGRGRSGTGGSTGEDAYSSYGSGGGYGAGRGRGRTGSDGMNEFVEKLGEAVTQDLKKVGEAVADKTAKLREGVAAFVDVLRR